MRFRDDKLEKPRIKRWTPEEYDYCVGRRLLDDQTIHLREGGLFCHSANDVEIPKQWTKTEYSEKVEVGFLYKQRVFLYRGELIEMPVMGTLKSSVSRLPIYQLALDSAMRRSAWRWNRK